MVEIIPDYLEESANRYPKKTAYIDKFESVTYEELRERAYKIAGQIIKRGYEKSPVAIYMEKSVRCIVAMLGVLCSGNYYTVLDMDMPLERIKKIISMLSPAVIIVDEKRGEQKIPGKVPGFSELRKDLGQYDVLDYEALLADGYDIKRIDKRKKAISPDDLSQVIFTSGSTGTPKGVMLSHGGVVSATESRTKCLGYSGMDIFANQFPFHFVGYLADFFCTLKIGATDYIIPKELFFSPKRIMEFLGEKKVTVLDWIAPALSLIAKYGALTDVILPYVKVVAFGGESIPVKYLRLWKKALPNAVFVNAYGSSELGGGILFHKTDREFEKEEQLPLGYPIEEAEIILLDENDRNTEKEGELCVKSDQLAMGYYKNVEETAHKFVQLCSKSGGKVTAFKTGDLVKYNDQGELIFVGRRDFQIKRHGYRIELGEIECIVNSLDTIRDMACIYDKKKEKIIVYYSGCETIAGLKKVIEKILPRYMIPDIYLKLEELPRNMNGKIDRVKLNILYEEHCEDA